MYECVGVASRWNQYSFASSPWFPSGPERPKRRSFRIGSRPFQNAGARQIRPWRSEKPAMPSSPHRYVRYGAASCGKYCHAVPSAL
jgi:hypothetical protein